MPTKSGQIVYMEDGSNAEQVYVANQTDTLAQPMDHQATLTNTAVTHTNVAVAPSTSSAQSAWTQVPEGMTEFVNNLTIDAFMGNVYTHVLWSEDGTNQVGQASITTSNSLAINYKTSPQWYPVGGAFYKAVVWNGDAAVHTCSANIKFRP